MWEKKDIIKKKIIPDKLKLYLFSFVFIFIFVSLDMLSPRTKSWNKGGFFGETYTREEYLRCIYIPIIVSLIAPTILFITNLIKYKKGYLKYDIVSGICDKCGICMNNVLEHTKCKCGGEVISYKHLVWIEDSKDKMK